MRKAAQFSQVKSAYLNSKKQPTPAKPKAAGVGNLCSKLKTSKGGLKVQSKRTLRQEVTVETLPTELLLKLFSHLDMKSVLSCCSTCHRWEQIASDNDIWKRFYCRHLLPKQKDKPENYINEPSSPLEVPEKYWKKRFLTKCKQLRNKRFLGLDKVNPFTGVTKNMREVLEKLGVKFQLCLTTTSDETFWYSDRKRNDFHSASMVRWYSLKAWPTINNISDVKVYALVPLVYGSDKRAIRNTPRQKVLVFEEKLHRKFASGAAFSETQEVRLVRTAGGILFALWQETDDTAFICLGLHHHDLLKKCILSTSSQIYSPIHEVQPDDVDKRYGLHGYKCHVLLHGSDEIILSEMFNCDDADDFVVGGSMQFTLNKFIAVRDFPSNAGFKWRTDLFSGKIENMAVIAVTLRDMNSDVIWSRTSPVAFHSPLNPEVDFLSLKDPLRITYEDGIGGIVMYLKPETSSDYFVDKIIINVRINAINSWFGTNHNML